MSKRKTEPLCGTGKWSYRFFRHVADSGEVYYAVHEAYYDKRDRVVAITVNPSRLAGYSDYEDAEFELARILAALGTPALDASAEKRKKLGYYTEIGPVPFRKRS